jgi:UDPglucose 6-dehydrogenase
MARVTVIGAGYVGLVTAVCLARSGNDTLCLDIDDARIEGLSAGRSPIYEPGIDELLADGLASGLLRFCTPADDWAPLLGDVVFVAVGTPASETGAADLSAVRSVAGSIAGAADHPIVMVMKSTVPPGTGDALRRGHLSNARVPIAYVSNPEFLREGRAIEDWYHTDRIVLGSAEPGAIDTVAALYRGIDAPIVRTDVASAETIKYASNAFLATKISFINEMANVCDAVGANIDSVALGLGLDARIGSAFLNAGIGYGGSCFPKDVRALEVISASSGYTFELLKAVIAVNARQRAIPVTSLERALGGLSGRTVAVLGLTFKPDTDDTREAPGAEIVAALVDGGASVRACDPLAGPVEMPRGAERVADAATALRGAHGVVLVTEWPEYVALDWAGACATMAPPRAVFDGRNALDAAAVIAGGGVYMAVGRDGGHRGETA